MTTRIAVDAMGSDNAPATELDAVVSAVRDGDPGIVILLVGDEARLREGLAARGARDEARITVRHAAQVVRMDDAPSSAVRSKRDSSMRICFDLVKEGAADALVSAGNSGAMLACGLLVLGRLPGVERPGIVATFPTVRGVCVLCDMGANVDPKAEVLAQFGLLGAVYTQVANGVRRPRVGLLSNGEEASKGTELTREAHGLLEQLARHETAGFVYVGYVEGKDIFGGEVDVVATDGFTGNVVLKTAEGAAGAVLTFLAQAFRSSLPAKLGALLAGPALRALRKKLDWAETGGAPLLGVDGVVMLCHGRSGPLAMRNAIFAAERYVKQGLRDQVAAAIARHSAVWSAAGTETPGAEGRQQA